MKAVKKTNFKGMKKPFGILFQGWGLLTGSTLFFLGAIASPSFAQVILVEENFQNSTLNPTYAPNWRFGRGNTTSDPPCLTAAPQVVPPHPDPSGNGFIPGCPTNTTNTGGVDAAGTGTLRLTPSKGNQATFVLFDKAIDSDQGLQITFDFFAYNNSNFNNPNNAADGISFFLLDGNATPNAAGAFGGSLGYAQKDTPTINGIEGGYVGIGFDEFGNYSTSTEGRQGGPGFRRDAVALRGAGSGTTGYQYLRGTGDADLADTPASLDFPAQTTRIGARRIARITLTPDNRISVEMDFGSGFIEIIPPYDLNTAPGQPAIPATFKFGFASSTGGFRNIHEIQNLLVTTLDPDLSITKAPVNAGFAAGLNEYTLTVANSPSAGRPTNTITVTDTLPPGFAFRSGQGTNWNCTAVGQQVTCTYTGTAPNPGATLPTITLQVIVTAPPGTYTNTATVTTAGDSNPANNTNAVQTLVLGTPRVGVAKQAGTIINNEDGTYTVPYTLTVRNYGNVAITNIQVQENLATTFGNSPFTVEANSLGSNTLTVNNGFNGSTDLNLLGGGNSLPVGASATIQFQVTVTPGNNLGPYNNSATASATGPGGTAVTETSTEGTNPDPDGDGDPTNNTSPTVVSFTENPRVGVAKQAGTITNNGDGTYTVPYTLTVQNYGDVAITNIQVEENLTTTFGNSPFTVVTNSLTSNTLTVNNGFNGSTDLNLLGGGNSLPVGASATIQFQVTVTPGNNLGPYNNSATASATSPGGTAVTDTSTEGTNPDPDGDGDPTNNTTPTAVTFGEVPLIGVAKAAGTPIDNGDRTFTIPYTLVVRNYGDVPLNTLQVTENLDETFANLTYTLEPNSLSSPTLTVNPSFNGNTDTNLLEAGNPNNTLAVDTEATISFQVRVTPGNKLGPFNNQVRASGVTPGGNGVNDWSTNGSNPRGNNNTGDPTDSNDVTPVTLRGNPNLELEKRITRVNGIVVGQSENLADWPDNFVRGVASSNTIQPGDEVEYTIYFLSAGSGPLENATVCDPLQDFQTFRTDTFNGQTPTEGAFGAEVGIALALNPNPANPDLPTAYLRSANSASNRGRFYPSGTATPLICEQNVRGAVVVDIGNLGVGDYGFIRFRVTID